MGKESGRMEGKSQSVHCNSLAVRMGEERLQDLAASGPASLQMGIQEELGTELGLDTLVAVGKTWGC
jgi:hypothetical protein